MKKILLVYYSQTGQLTHLAENFVQSLEQAGVFVEKLAIKPQQEYPFPWRFMRFFNTFPETVHLTPPPIEPLPFQHEIYASPIPCGFSPPASRLPLFYRVNRQKSVEGYARHHADRLSQYVADGAGKSEKTACRE